MIADYLVVGAGLTGATIARYLVDRGHDVLVIDRRTHVGGNVHDYVHESGIRIHTYGPHYFRTSADSIWDFVRRFADFYPFEAVLMSEVDGRLEHWPVQEEYILRAVGQNWQRTIINGSTVVQEGDNTIVTDTTRGLLVQPTNSGEFSRHVLSVVPEVDLTLAWE